MRFSCACFIVSSSVCVFDFKELTSPFVFSASSFNPCFIKSPICLESVLMRFSSSSNCACASFRLLSIAKTASMASFALGKCFFSRPRTMASLFSMICLIVSIANHVNNTFLVEKAKVRKRFELSLPNRNKL